MENGLVGTDVNPIAAHLTSSSLAAIGEGEPYGNTRIGWVDVGGAEGRTGSIEYFERAQVGDLFTTYGGRSTGDEPADKTTVDVPDGSFRWLLMNPPYSRTRGKQSAFDIAGLTDSERKRCQKRWGLLIGGEPANKKAGMGATYLVLAARKVKPGGRIGFVLPLTAAFAESWAQTRQMIEREFKDIVALTVAAGQALGRDALSADTGMEEMLLVATRRENTVVRPYRRTTPAAPICCVTLRKPLARLGEAGEIGRAIIQALSKLRGVGHWRPIRAGDDELGIVLVFEAGGEGAPWGPLGATKPDLALAADTLAKGRIDYVVDEPIPLPVPMSTMADLFDVGPTHDLIGHPHGGDGRGAFEFHRIKPHLRPDKTVQGLSDSELALAVGGADAIGRDRALWGVASKQQKRLLVGPTHKGVSPAGVGSRKDREKMRAKRSDLFYARNMRWTSQALLAASSVAPLMGGRAWTTLAHSDPRVKRASALWVNSIFGMVVHWTQGQRTHAGRSTTQIDALKQIPVPRLDQLDDAALERATALFQELQTVLLAPACRAHADPTRAAIDQAVVSFLDLPQEAIHAAARLRLLWCSEPSVHGWNRKALSLLQKAGVATVPRN